MGPQVRMAGSLSVNKRKTAAADNSPTRGRGRREALRRPSPPMMQGRPYTALLPTDFHGFAR